MQILNPQVNSNSLDPSLNLESRLEDLVLYDCSINIEQPSAILEKIFKENQILPGIILKKDGEFFGMLSRRQFLEILSRPFGPDLFLKRGIHLLYEQASKDILVLSAETKILDAVQSSLNRAPEFLYEPIIVQFTRNVEKILDAHTLLLAQTQIHELTTKLLHEQTQAKLLQTEKMASLGEMVAGVAHEILNPVNFICGNLEYLSTYTNDLIQIFQAYETEFPQASQKIESLKASLDVDFLLQDLPKIVDSMVIGSNRLRKIISSLRSYAHMDEAVKRPVDIHECLDTTLLILNSRIKNTITVIKNYGDLPEVNCFSGQINQVFTNLIANSIDVLTERIEAKESSWQPQIVITTMLLPKSSERIYDQVEVSFQDNGPGIPLELQAKIFEIFFTTKAVGKGTGFGLAISRQIIEEKHGGKLMLQSAPGAGTTFIVLLPLQ